MATTSDPRIGTALGAYRIDAVIGRGGMGVVYRATDTNLDRPVALKLLGHDYVDDEAFRARFLRESKMAAAIDHPNIIPIYEAGERDGTYFLAMRFVQGSDLASRLRGGPLEARAVVSLLSQVAGALDAAHAAGLVHRDVKPANLLVASGHGADRSDHVYLTDFGLTKQRGSQTGLTRTGSFLGTLEYVSPEQIEGKPVDGRADQYALAAIAIECLTGEPPFPRDSDLAIINAHLRDAPPSVHERKADLPAAADAVVARGLAKDPAARYPDCQSFVDALRDALGVTGTQPRPTRARADRRVPLAIGAIVILAVVLAGVVILGLQREEGPSSSPGGASLAPGTPSSQAPAAEATAFPSKAESDFLAVLPPEIAADCQRGSYAILAQAAFEAWPAPDVSVTCALAPESGASSVLIRKFPPLGSGQGFASSHTLEGFVNYFADRVAHTPPGDCAQTSPAVGTWSIGDEDVGSVVCYTETATGDAVMYWSYEDERVLVKAINQRGEDDGLRQFFDSYRRFIARP